MTAPVLVDVVCGGPCGDVTPLARVERGRPAPELVCGPCGLLQTVVEAAERAGGRDGGRGPLQPHRVADVLDGTPAADVVAAAGRWLDERPNARTPELRDRIATVRKGRGGLLP